MAKNDGGPAFPELCAGHVEEPHGSADKNMWFTTRAGMSLRDHFAAAALVGFMSRPADALEQFAREANGGQFVARAAYALADAMIAAREVTHE